MKDRFDSIFAQARQETLTKKERTDLRARIFSAAGIPESHSVPSQWMGVAFIGRHVGAFAFALLLFFGTGGTLLAEQSLPGDFLYGMKTNVNEKVLGWFADSDESRAEWHLELADRRLAEIEKLSLSHELSENVRADLTGQIATHVKNVLGDSYEEEFKEPDPSVGEDTTLMMTTVATETEATIPDPASAQFSEEETALSDDSQTMKRSAFFAPESSEDRGASFDERLLGLKKALDEEKTSLRSGKAYIRAKGLFIVASSLNVEASALWNKGDTSQASRLWEKADHITALLETMLDRSPDADASSLDQTPQEEDRDKREEEGEAKKEQPEVFPEETPPSSERSAEEEGPSQSRTLSPTPLRLPL